MKQRLLKGLCGVVLLAYLLLLTRLIVFKYPAAMTQAILSGWSVDGLIRHIHTANLTPLHTISRSLLRPRLRIEVTTLVYNVAAFVPLGILLPCLGARTLRGVLVVALLVSGTLELIQLVTILGEADVDDVILNVLGAVIGFVGFKLASALYRRTPRADRG